MSQRRHDYEREAVLLPSEVGQASDHFEIFHDFGELALPLYRYIQPPAFVKNSWLKGIGGLAGC